MYFLAHVSLEFILQFPFCFDPESFLSIKHSKPNSAWHDIRGPMNACYLEKWNETIVLLLSIDSVNIVFGKNKTQNMSFNTDR